MSFMANKSPISIAAQETQNWVWTWDNQGWQGNTAIQPQPLQPFHAALSCTMGVVTANQNGSYSFSFSIANTAQNAETTTYNIQISVS
jgi:hypothetical protein